MVHSFNESVDNAYLGCKVRVGGTWSRWSTLGRGKSAVSTTRRGGRALVSSGGLPPTSAGGSSPAGSGARPRALVLLEVGLRALVLLEGGLRAPFPLEGGLRAPVLLEGGLRALVLLEALVVVVGGPPRPVLLRAIAPRPGTGSGRRGRVPPRWSAGH